jgi:hypothetical protein
MPMRSLTEADRSASARSCDLLRRRVLIVNLSRRHLLIGMVSDSVGTVVVIAGAVGVVVVGGHRCLSSFGVVDTVEARQRS